LECTIGLDPVGRRTEGAGSARWGSDGASDGVLDLLDEDLEELALELHHLSISTNLPAQLDRLARRRESLNDDVTILILRRTLDGMT
jgi:hypothetical protein